jgi:hypothetical protein
MQQLFFRIAAIKIGSMAAMINDWECSNKYLGKEQLLNNRESSNK